MYGKARRRGIRGRVEFAALAVARYGVRVCDISRLLDKQPNSVTRWLNHGLRLERDDPGLENLLAWINAANSRRS
ncbi:MAG TPA: hypothetical protein VLT81_07380 [Chondromyces sp.]|nr:hypothetical protein [Chondromyces sp.]